MISGEDGILSRAKDSKNTSEKAQVEEELKLAWTGVQTDSYAHNLSTQEKVNSLQTELQNKDSTSTATLINNQTRIRISYKGYNSIINIKNGTISVTYNLDKLKSLYPVYYYSTFDALLSSSNNGAINANESNTTEENAKIFVYSPTPQETNCILLDDIEISDDEIDFNNPINFDLNQYTLKSTNDDGTSININNNFNISNGKVIDMYLNIYDSVTTIENIESELSSIYIESKLADLNISYSTLNSTDILLDYNDEIENYEDGAKFTISNSTINNNDGFSTYGILLNNAGIYNISNTSIYVKNSEGKKSNGIIISKGYAVIDNVTSIIDNNKNIDSTNDLSGVALSIGQDVRAIITGGYFSGLHSGASIHGDTEINGGTYESPDHGGIYFGQGPIHIKGATLKLSTYNGEFPDSVATLKNNYGIFYIGNTVDKSYVFMDSCTLVSDYGPKPGSLTTSYNHKDSYLFVSNTKFADWIRVDGPRSYSDNYPASGHVYIGKNVEYHWTGYEGEGKGLVDAENYLNREFNNRTQNLQFLEEFLANNSN